MNFLKYSLFGVQFLTTAFGSLINLSQIVLYLISASTLNLENKNEYPYFICYNYSNLDECINGYFVPPSCAMKQISWLVIEKL